MTTTPVYPPTLATSVTLAGSTAPFELFAGEADVTSQSGPTTTTAIAQFQVVALDGSGNVVPFNPGGSGSVTKAIGVAAQAAAANDNCIYYNSGFFNSDVLGWPSATNTLALRKAAFAGTGISVGQILGAQFPA